MNIIKHANEKGENIEKLQSRKNIMFWNFKSSKVIWNHITKDYIPNMKKIEFVHIGNLIYS
jgi:hypothetical protein